MLLKKTMLGAAMALGLAVVPANANLIVNGGFESGTFTPIGGGITTYDLITQAGPQDLTGWTVGNSLVWGVNTTDINPYAGSGFVDLTGVGDTLPHGALNQAISTIAGQLYTFSIFLTQDFSSSIVGINVFADGVALALFGTPGVWNYQPTGATYGQMSGVFAAVDSSTLISIQSIKFGSQVFMIGLDNVSVTGPVPEVPVPAGFLLLISALGGLGFLTRFRKAASAA